MTTFRVALIVTLVCHGYVRAQNVNDTVNNVGSSNEISMSVTLPNLVDEKNIRKGLSQANNETLCRLISRQNAGDSPIVSTVERKIKSGTKLIKYDVQFPDYDRDPLEINATFVYKPHQWQRVFGDHGKTLLSLAFNYDILSLQMLTFGVEEITVNVTDDPPRCFQDQDDDTKRIIIRELLLSDFRGLDSETPDYIPEENYLCQQLVIERENGYADFKYECCSKPEEGSNEIECHREEQDKWIQFLYMLIFVLKLSFFFLGPLVLQKWIYHRSIRKADYTIKLEGALRKTLVVKKIRSDMDSSNVVEPRKDFPGQFSKFKEIVKALPSEEVVPVNISRLHIQVDHKSLMDEKSVPTGLLYYVWTNFFQCGLRRYEPFLSCCRESIVGSWDARFLWLRLFSHGSECNKSCRKYLSWGHITGLVGGLILMASVAAPFIIRVMIYYMYEEPEIITRKEAIEALGLNERISGNLFHYFTPTHGLFITLYIGYTVSFLLLAFYQTFEVDTFEEIVLGSLQDLRSISRLECGRLLISHLLLPFEKFGLCGGVLVACIYWAFALPLCLITIIWYCLPTLYLTGRFTIQSRPTFVKYSALPYVPKYQTSPAKNLWALESLSLGITSIESCMMLNNISPNTRDDRPPSFFTTNPCKNMKCTSHAIWTELTKVFVGLMCIVWMYSVLIMYAECFGFIVEGFVMILMGAVVNAGSAANYIMVSFWAITYSVSCYNDAYERYMNLNTKVFEYIKEKLSDDIKKLTLMREKKQRYTAFKYFTAEDIQNEAQIEIEADMESTDELNAVLGSAIQRRLSKEVSYEDSIEYIEGKLHWKVHHLTLFVDKKDVPRIPRELFEKICHIEAPGCPGPVYKGLLKATQKFLYMVVFLVFVAIVVNTFGNMYNVSSTNQLLVTLAGGFVPFVIRFVLQPKQMNIDLNTYTFEGKVHEIIKTFQQTWPVHDLTFTLDSTVAHRIPNGPDGTRNVSTADAITSEPIPRQVDLLITIREEDITDPTFNLRSETGSLGSIPSGHRGSPDATYSPVRNQNNPTNATNALALQHSRPDAAYNTPTHHEECIPLNTIRPIQPKDNNDSTQQPISRKVKASIPEEVDTMAAPVQLVVGIGKNGETEIKSIGSGELNESDDNGSGRDRGSCQEDHEEGRKGSPTLNTPSRNDAKYDEELQKML